MSDFKRRRIVADEELDNFVDDRERFVRIDNDDNNSNPDENVEGDNEDEGEGEDLAETWDK